MNSQFFPAESWFPSWFGSSDSPSAHLGSPKNYYPKSSTKEYHYKPRKPKEYHEELHYEPKEEPKESHKEYHYEPKGHNDYHYEPHGKHKKYHYEPHGDHKKKFSGELLKRSY